ncbi:hypothetical protein B0H15DRAFT_958579 [Mycena belliarum]|uniref:Uncharacterized protein n=1 Tax=Mycena belliarum TaxID=1033014 RepID=A0AAD6TM94_9AGAR|nr:hypothetical protein B0H15DRAFT_958579 [Mycena belliae]
MSRQFHSIPTSPLLAHPQQVPTTPPRSPETVAKTTHTAATEATTTTKPTTSPYLALYKKPRFSHPALKTCSLCLTGVPRMLLQQRAETFAAGGSSALIARFSALVQSRRQVDLFRALTAHAFEDFNHSLRHLAFVFIQTKAELTQEELVLYFEDPNDLAVVQGALKRLKVSRVKLWDEFKPRAHVSERQGAPPTPGGSVAMQMTLPTQHSSTDWIDSPEVQEYLTGPQGYLRPLPTRDADSHPSRGHIMPLTASTDPELFEALQDAAPDPPHTPPMASLDGPEGAAPATPPRAPPPFTFTRESRAPPTTPGSVPWAGRAVMRTAALPREWVWVSVGGLFVL